MHNSLGSMLRIEITSADISKVLNTIASSGIVVKDVNLNDNLTVEITISYGDKITICNICDKLNAEYKIKKRVGMLWILHSILKRPVLLVFALILLSLFCFLPSRIMFVKVQGNASVATNRILDAAELCGIKFGADRRWVRSEKMKNSLLQAIPELQWAGINTSGCVAIISVREKTTQDVNNFNQALVSSIVASRDGVIRDCVVYRGNSLCNIGQAVKKGQLLVSGYTDCGIVTKATQADAEITALTFHEIEAICPDPSINRGELVSRFNRYSLRIGKKVINLYKHSGNYGTGCVKIYTERYAHLPGGFVLPLAVVKESILCYDSTSVDTASSDTVWLKSYAEEYLLSSMVAGKIISSQIDQQILDDATVLYGRYACVEMIGKTRFEQMMNEGE